MVVAVEQEQFLAKSAWILRIRLQQICILRVLAMNQVNIAGESMIILAGLAFLNRNRHEKVVVTGLLPRPAH